MPQSGYRTYLEDWRQGELREALEEAAQCQGEPEPPLEPLEFLGWSAFSAAHMCNPEELFHSSVPSVDPEELEVEWWMATYSEAVDVTTVCPPPGAWSD